MRDGRALEDLLIEIGGKREPVEERSQAIVEIVQKNGDLNCVAIASLHKLSVIDRTAAASVARALLKEQCCEDREMVRAAAIRALVESGAVLKQDLRTIAQHLHHRFGAVRSGCQRSLRDLEARDRAKLCEILVSEPGDDLSQLKIFVQALPPARRNCAPELDMLDTPVRAPREQRSAPRPKMVTVPKTEIPRGELPTDTRKLSSRVTTTTKPGVVEVAAKRTRQRDAAQRDAARKPSSGDAVNLGQGNVGKEHRTAESAQEQSKPPMHDSSMLPRSLPFDEFRSPEFNGMKPDALREVIRTSAQPDSIIGALAELAVQSGIEVARGAADKLIWELSNPANKGNASLEKFVRIIFS